MHPVFRLAVLSAGSAFLALSNSQVIAGVQASADKEIAQQQVAADNAFPLHFTLSVGGESEFVFRGVDILPEVDINVSKAATEGINLVPALNGDPSFRQFLAENHLTPKQFVKLIAFPTAPVEVSHESGIYYVEGNVTAYNFTLGAFYATQAEGRADHNFFGNKPVFDAYHEFDAYASYTHPIGPVEVTLGGTVYHVVNNTDFNTAELNFQVAYTPPQFRYVSASFSYDYAGAFNFSDYRDAANGVQGSYIDGHYLEVRIDGNVPVYKHVVTFNPYILVAAGSGIMPRAFNPAQIPTFVNTEGVGKSLEAPFAAILYNKLHPNGPKETVQPFQTVRAGFQPDAFDRSFDLSSFEAGFRVPFYLTRYITIRGDFNYSRPLGNLDRAPYNQHDELWGGGRLTFSF